MINSAPAHLFNSPSAVSSERVVFAVSPRARARYFPLFEPKEFADVEYQWLDFPISSSNWEKLLFKLRPTVLVTEWGTPAIPDGFAHTPDLSLRYICHLKGAVRRLVPRHLLERGVSVSNWGSAISYSVAEHALLLTLASLRKVPMWNSTIRQWPTRHDTTPRDMLRVHSLRGKRVGLHGFGSVARELVNMLRPFNVELMAYSSGVPRSFFEKHGVRPCANLRELFSSCEVLIECEALTPESENSVTEDMLRCLPPDGVFVNVGRGLVVDEKALIRVAAEGWLRVGLDVFHREPLPADSDLLQNGTLLLSPHIAGPTEDSYQALWDHAMNNIRRYLNGEPLNALITPEIYDRLT